MERFTVVGERTTSAQEIPESAARREPIVNFYTVINIDLVKRSFRFNQSDAVGRIVDLHPTL